MSGRALQYDPNGGQPYVNRLLRIGAFTRRSYIFPTSLIVLVLLPGDRTKTYFENERKVDYGSPTYFRTVLSSFGFT